MSYARKKLTPLILIAALLAVFMTISFVRADEKPMIEQKENGDVIFRRDNIFTMSISPDETFEKSETRWREQKEQKYYGLAAGHKYYYEINDIVTGEQITGTFTRKKYHQTINSVKKIKKKINKHVKDHKKGPLFFYTNLSKKTIRKLAKKYDNNDYMNIYCWVDVSIDSEKGSRFDDNIIVGGKKGYLIGVYPYYELGKKNTKKHIRITKRIMKKVVKGNARQKVCRLDKWMVKHTKYDYKTMSKYYGYHVTLKRRAICSGFTKFFDAIMYEEHVPCKYVRWSHGKWSHAWNIVKIKGKWYHVDTTWDVCAGYGKHILIGYNDKRFRKMHYLTDGFYKKYMPKSKFGKNNLSTKIKK